MRDLDYLTLLSREYKNRQEAAAEIIRLRALCNLPKGTEYFFSDLHGEHQAFIHMLRSCSGNIKSKIKETFGGTLLEEEQLELARLIYYPERQLKQKNEKAKRSTEWQEKTIHQLLAITRTVSKKWSRKKIVDTIPNAYGELLEELICETDGPWDKKEYYGEMMNAILDTDCGYDVINCLCNLIRDLLMDQLHIIGDIFDRGPRADLIIDELMEIPRVDIQWGNHDVSWMGAAAGCDACIATVLRIATAYNCFDVLEDGYGINMRPLSMFAQEVYEKDNCKCFKPHLLDENHYDVVNPTLAAKMCKAISIIEFKLEGQLIRRHPEYHMEDRLLLDKINYETGEITIKDQVYKLKDTNFPTIDPADPYALSEKEKALMDVLHMSFLHSGRLQKQIRFLFSKGSMYLVRNSNLLFHGCIPMDAQGEFLMTTFLGEELSGKALMDELEKRCNEAYFSRPEWDQQEENTAADIFWYLWSGAESPLFGKDKMASFEGFFIDNAELKKEAYNFYYRHVENEEMADKILMEFGIDPKKGHIINGHVPVKVTKGELPVKANGKVYVIDGGISKAYQAKTGIAGYTLIYNSHRLALAQHMPFLPGEEDTPVITEMEEMRTRVLLRDVDEGKGFLTLIQDLEELLNAFKKGTIKEKR